MIKTSGRVLIPQKNNCLTGRVQQSCVDCGDVRRRRQHFIRLVRADLHLGLTEPDAVMHFSRADDDIYGRLRRAEEVDDGRRCNYRLCL
jgi:hypothetical protein